MTLHCVVHFPAVSEVLMIVWAADRGGGRIGLQEESIHIIFVLCIYCEFLSHIWWYSELLPTLCSEITHSLQCLRKTIVGGGPQTRQT